ncbi:hypothetical protein C9374_000928 [Naegleria lovaniensis]|uniref:Uncharacterized protein n=1 Tax=Naegleria lovaniensis TaxID=51637 RepID=A0AA88GYN7_NAELO|nr:uncharacterized protein C9374_000928 [Naegleria lovaniensis]KAG2388078.1 hypothetical protein C9374_000928 [Naegleria lovaniensis]
MSSSRRKYYKGSEPAFNTNTSVKKTNHRVPFTFISSIQESQKSKLDSTEPKNKKPSQVSFLDPLPQNNNSPVQKENTKNQVCESKHVNKSSISETRSCHSLPNSENMLAFRNPYARKTVKIILNQDPLDGSFFSKTLTEDDIHEAEMTNTVVQEPSSPFSRVTNNSSLTSSPINTSRNSLKLSPIKAPSMKTLPRNMSNLSWQSLSARGSMRKQRPIQSSSLNSTPRQRVRPNERAVVNFEEDDNDADYQYFLSQNTNSIYNANAGNSNSPQHKGDPYSDPFARPLFLRAPKRKTTGESHIKREYITTLRLLGFDDIDNKVDLDTLSFFYERRENDFSFIDPSLGTHSKHLLKMLKPSEYVKDNLEEKKKKPKSMKKLEPKQIEINRKRAALLERGIDLESLKPSYDQYQVLVKAESDLTALSSLHQPQPSTIIDTNRIHKSSSHAQNSSQTSSKTNQSTSTKSNSTINTTTTAAEQVIVITVPPTSDACNGINDCKNPADLVSTCCDDFIDYFFNEEKLNKKRYLSGEERVTNDAKQIMALSRELFDGIPTKTSMTIAKIFANPEHADRISREQYVMRARKYKAELRKKKQQEQEEYERAKVAVMDQKRGVSVVDEEKPSDDITLEIK